MSFRLTSCLSRWITGFLLMAFVSMAGAAASAEQKIALVIGNSAYPSAALKNPVNDAKAMAAKLGSLGFEVILRTDASQRDMTRAVSQFGQKLKGGSVGLFYFAGHGMQVRGKNFLIPIDAEIENEASTRSEAVDVDQVLEQLGSARLSMVILDACRNNPFERRFRSAGNGGLAQIDAPTGTLLAYATAPGKVAYDGTGANGLYTTELLKALDTPGLKVEDVFKQVRINVLKASDNQQIPWESSSLTGEFFFKAALRPQNAGNEALQAERVQAEVQKALDAERQRREQEASTIRQQSEQERQRLARELEDERKKRDKDSEIVRAEMEKLRAELLKLTAGVSTTLLSAKPAITPEKVETAPPPTQIATVRPAPETAKVVAAPQRSASSSAEWDARIALLTQSKTQLNFAKAFALLLNVSDPTELEVLVKFEKVLDQAAWSNALAFGVDEQGQSAWATGGRFADLPRAIDEVQEMCSKSARRPCKIIFTNRDFRPKEFFELVDQFKTIDFSTVRQSILTRLASPPQVTDVVNGRQGNSGFSYSHTQIYSSRATPPSVTAMRTEPHTSNVASPPAPAQVSPSSRPSTAEEGEAWNLRVTRLEQAPANLTYAKSMALLFDITDPEDLGLLSSYEKTFGQLGWPIAHAFGIRDDGQPLWATSSRTRDLNIGQTTAIDSCEALGAQSCKVIFVNGDFRKKDLAELAKTFKSHDINEMRTRYLQTIRVAPKEVQTREGSGAYSRVLTPGFIAPATPITAAGNRRP